MSNHIYIHIVTINRNDGQSKKNGIYLQNKATKIFFFVPILTYCHILGWATSVTIRSCILAPLNHPLWVLRDHNFLVWVDMLGKAKTADVFLPLTSPRGALLLGFLSYQPSIHKPSLHTSSPLSSSLLLRIFWFLMLSFPCFTYNLLLYKVFKILFVLYDVSMVMFFIKEEENLFLLLVCFIILF